MLRTLLLAVLLCGAARPVLAVTVDDIVALARAGVTAEVLVAVIDADRSIFSLTPEQIVALKKAGVPDAVVLKMLGSADEFRPEAPPPLIVGADRPEPAPPATVVVPYPILPYPIFVGVPVVVPGPLTFEAPRGFGRFINDGFVEGRGFGRFINTP
jgi:hypothetical protein